jgi:LPS export ABC transporter protein LptC
MANNVRKILLIFVIGILGFSIYHVLSKNNSPVEKIVLKALDAGIDIEIENFKVVHEVSGGEKWELTADLAQINQEKDLTLLTNVKLIIKENDKQKLWVIADSGSIMNDSNDIQLEGNVKMIGASEEVTGRTGKKNQEPQK